MTINETALLDIVIPDRRHEYAESDLILYALALGYGEDPLDERALRYCYEKALRPVPTAPLVLAHPGFWMREHDTGVDWRQIVHLDQSLEILGQIPISGAVTGKTRVLDVLDRGVGRGAIVRFERTLINEASGEIIARMMQSNLCRADGGFSGRDAPLAIRKRVPDRSPDSIIEVTTRPETALLYRLSADLNPLHADPASARQSGFPKPILHGLATFGIVCRALIKSRCDYDGSCLSRIAARFTGIVYPSDTLSVELWNDTGEVRFRARVPARDVIVVDDGVVAWRSDKESESNSI